MSIRTRLEALERRRQGITIVELILRAAQTGDELITDADIADQVRVFGHWTLERLVVASFGEVLH